MIKIRSLELENVKKVKALTLTPSQEGLTIIGGDNMEGKTSVLDAIAYAVGGEKFRPSNLKREGAIADPYIKAVLSTGLIIERRGKNSELKVTDPSGKKAGQKLLDGFISEFAIDLPKFIQSTPKEKANTLLGIIGVGDQLAKLEQEEQKLYNERHGIGIVADRKAKFAEEQASFANVPEFLITASELIERQKSILAKNAENDRLRANLANLRRDDSNAMKELEQCSKELAKAKMDADKIRKELQAAEAATLELSDKSTEQLECELSKVEETNAKIRANLDKQKALEDAAAMRKDYEALSGAIEAVRIKRNALLDGAKMPLQGLSVEAGELTMNGKKWDCMSGAEQLCISTAIVKELKPECGFILIDGLEQMDMKTLATFGAWLESKGMQAIATRVSQGDECSIIIEDGHVKELMPVPVFETGKF